VYVFKPFLGSYSAKKGENLATKEDIAQLTKITEGIKAKISDEVWDRQRQWEVRRDAVINTIRDISSLRDALAECCGAFNAPNMDYQKVTGTKYDECYTRFACSKLVVDAVAGKELTESLDDFQKFVRRVFETTIARNSASLREINVGDELAKKTAAAIRAARKELKIRDEDSSSSIRSDH
jgi:hypothetical protein